MNVFRMIISPPPSAKGISNMGKMAVPRARMTDQADLALLDNKPARGIVNEPMMGTQMVSRVRVSVFSKKDITLCPNFQLVDLMTAMIFFTES
jgi:hypothetical protein